MAFFAVNIETELYTHTKHLYTIFTHSVNIYILDEQALIYCPHGNNF
jgi:hypothetical protein